MTDNTIDDSPYGAVQIDSGDGRGLPVTGVNVTDDTINRTGTVVLQVETGGSGTFGHITATGVGMPGSYSIPYRASRGRFSFVVGAGNSGWTLWPVRTAFPRPVRGVRGAGGSRAASWGPSARPVPQPVASTRRQSPDLARNQAGTSAYVAPPSPRLAAPNSRPLPVRPVRRPSREPRPRPSPPAESSWCRGGNLARGATMLASGSTQVYLPSNANDGDASSYWESTDNAFPQWLEAELGATCDITALVLRLPRSPLWLARTQTLSVLGSTNGSSWRTLRAPAGYTFSPSADNTVSIDLPASRVRYVRLAFSGNTDWRAGQISEFEIFRG